MTPSELLAFFLAITVAILALPITLQSFRSASFRSGYRYRSLVSLFAGLTLIAAYFAWRDHNSVQQLKALIDVPPYDRSVYVPRAAEIRTIARSLPANVPPDFPLTRQEAEQARNELISAKDSGTFWILETSSRPPSVLNFYKDADHRRGWEIAEQSSIHLVLRHQNTTLTIFFLDDFPRPDTAIVYDLN
jgi:hypothetical protein